MGIGYVRNDTSNNIADGKVVDAADLDGEFDAIASAFDSSTGHSHDGTSAEGGAVNHLGPAQEYIADASKFYPKTDNTYDLGSATFEWKNLYIDGTAYLDAAEIASISCTGGTVDGTAIGSITPSTAVFTSVGTTNVTTNLTPSDTATYSLGTNSVRWSSGYISGTMTATDFAVGDSIHREGDVGDNITFTDSVLTFQTGSSTRFAISNSEVTSARNVVPSVDGSFDLGSSSFEWRDLYVTRVAYLDEVDIDAGSIDGTAIGANSASTGAFTTLNATGALGNNLKASIYNAIYPVNSLYHSTSAANPNTIFGVGTWVDYTSTYDPSSALGGAVKVWRRTA